MPETSVNLEDNLRQLIIANEFHPLSWIREESVSAQLGVSRTPLREACARLSSEGLLERIPRRGYRLPDLNLEQLNDTYPVMVALEEFAVSTLASTGNELADQLDKANFVIGSDQTTSKHALVDYQWHCALVSATNNQVLIKHFNMLYARIARYIHFYWETPSVEVSHLDHKNIADSIRDDDVQLAGALLKSHRRKGLQRIRHLIEASSSSSTD